MNPHLTDQPWFDQVRISDAAIDIVMTTAIIGLVGLLIVWMVRSGQSKDWDNRNDRDGGPPESE